MKKVFTLLYVLLMYCNLSALGIIEKNGRTSNSYSIDVIPVGRVYSFHFFTMKFDSEDTFTIDYFGSTEQYKYRLEMKGGLTFMTIDSPSSTNKDDFFLDFPDKTYLVMYNEKNISFYGKGNEFYEHNYESPSVVNYCDYIATDRITSVNHLVENNTEYSAKNVTSYKLDDVWAMPNNGKNSSLIFDSTDKTRSQAYLDTKTDQDESKTLETKRECLIWSSGYVSYDKPNLYTENARPKRILITVQNPRTNKENKYYFDLKDTPHPQILEYDMLIFYPSASKITTIEIMDIYPGTKYNDVCVNSIRYYFGQK